MAENQDVRMITSIGGCQQGGGEEGSSGSWYES